MNIVFEEFFVVQFFHNYYINSILPGIKIKPTPSCASLLKNQRIFFKENKAGFITLIEVTENSSTKPLINFNTKIKFSFAVYIDNPFLKNFTDLNLNLKPYYIYHFSNLNNNVQNSELLLSAALDKEYVSDNDLIILKSQRFSYYNTSDKTSVKIEIKVFENNTIFSKTAFVYENYFQSDINLLPYPPGRYKLFVDNDLKLDFYADDYSNSKKIFGVIDIYTGSSIGEDFCI